MEITYDGLTEAGFTPENWPSDVPKPTSEYISHEAIGETEVRYRFDVTIDGTDYALAVELDTSTVPDPHEGVSFMLNKFAFFWRTSPEKLELEAGESPDCIQF